MTTFVVVAFFYLQLFLVVSHNRIAYLLDSVCDAGSENPSRKLAG